MVNEKRLIDPDALITTFEKIKNETTYPWFHLDEITDEIMDEIMDSLTVDAVEVVHGQCDWCKPGEEYCGTCRKFFDYYGDGGSDRCSSGFDSNKCAYYEPIEFCPNCGAKMDGDGNG